MSFRINVFFIIRLDRLTLLADVLAKQGIERMLPWVVIVMYLPRSTMLLYPYILSFSLSIFALLMEVLVTVQKKKNLNALMI